MSSLTHAQCVDIFMTIRHKAHCWRDLATGLHMSPDEIDKLQLESANMGVTVDTALVMLLGKCINRGVTYAEVVCVLKDCQLLYRQIPATEQQLTRYPLDEECRRLASEKSSMWFVGGWVMGISVDTLASMCIESKPRLPTFNAIFGRLRNSASLDMSRVKQAFMVCSLS